MEEEEALHVSSERVRPPRITGKCCCWFLATATIIFAALFGSSSRWCYCCWGRLS